ncbi:Protein kinase domain-containing protein [Plasmodiophora brassicae]|uniref:Protein kinase domain-containing protein n=1 Tax=Plasmodiophora brassicae TaxID=37360 RepID=A0A0G4J7N1_PLABS|nr:hypothetical protein PBRA_003026 [Plasmodiophora brassicae]SPQ95500.1 unnamed protein product [Plasmodiophora brassicae]
MARSLATAVSGASASLAPLPGVVYPTHPDAYELKAELGKGAFATVFLAYCKATDEHVAIKILDLEELDTSWEEIRKEIAVMGLLNHPNVVRCLCSFVVDREIWLVMPLLAGGSCADIMKRNFQKGFDDEVLIATILKEALQGLEYLHKDGRIHRDIKAGNILISVDGQIQIADFGVAGTLVESGDRRKSRKTFVGTPCWMAPEVMEQTSGYDQKADIWSFGITALELAYGRPPYSHYQPMKVMILTLQEEPPTCSVYEDNQKKFSRTFKAMIASCLKKDPTKRPTAEKLLQNKFFKLAKKNQYVVDALLSQIPMPKLSADSLVRRSRNSSVSVSQAYSSEEKSANVVTSWVFSPSDVRAFKEEAAADVQQQPDSDSQAKPASAAAAAMPNPFDEIEQTMGGGDAKGQFTVLVTEAQADAKATTDGGDRLVKGPI